MQSEVMFAGFGGQGILSSGKILARAAMQQGYHVAWIPSYGPEMRGGTAYCTVIISTKLIGSPIIRNPKHLVAMNRPSLEKFAPMVQPQGIIIVNSSLISIGSGRTDVDEVKVPTVDIAEKIGHVKGANIVALAAFVQRSKLIDKEILEKSVRKEFSSKPELAALNLKVFEAGINAAHGH